MIKFPKKAEDCCGCTACASICSQGAITMGPDKLGFLYPKLDKSKCVNCGLCDNVCAFNEHYDSSNNLKELEAYGARHKNIDEVMSSRSGAAFVAISDRILELGGVVYGVGFTDHFRVAHKRATNKQQRDEFKGSKYVQSDLTGIFHQVKKDLRSGLYVLFSGTPCQTAGLNSYVGNRLREKLYLIDIVCHGVPSPAVWKDYITFLEKRYNDVIVGINFRDKQHFGWSAHKETFRFSKNPEEAKTFRPLFYRHVMFRYSCNNCHYCNLIRPSDLTLGDFWGWEKIDPSINKDDNGLSLILVNSEKGRYLWEYAKKDLYTIPVNINDCIQPNMKYPPVIHKNRKKFEKDYIKKGFDYAFYHDYSLPTKSEKIKKRVEQIIEKLLKINIK